LPFGGKTEEIGTKSRYVWRLTSIVGAVVMAGAWPPPWTRRPQSFGDLVTKAPGGYRPALAQLKQADVWWFNGFYMVTFGDFVGWWWRSPHTACGQILKTHRRRKCHSVDFPAQLAIARRRMFFG
jgi:hypothetical protein